MSPDYYNAERIMNVERIKLPDRQKNQVKLPTKVRQISVFPMSERR